MIKPISDLAQIRLYRMSLMELSAQLFKFDVIQALNYNTINFEIIAVLLGNVQLNFEIPE